MHVCGGWVGTLVLWFILGDFVKSFLPRLSIVFIIFAKVPGIYIFFHFKASRSRYCAFHIIPFHIFSFLLSSKFKWSFNLNIQPKTWILFGFSAKEQQWSAISYNKIHKQTRFTYFCACKKWVEKTLCLSLGNTFSMTGYHMRTERLYQSKRFAYNNCQ